MTLFVLLVQPPFHSNRAPAQLFSDKSFLVSMHASGNKLDKMIGAVMSLGSGANWPQICEKQPGNLTALFAPLTANVAPSDAAGRGRTSG